MIARVRLTRILSIAVPIILGLLSQTVMNLVDTSMVRDTGNAALAAVGLASFANFVAGAPIMGLSAGVQALAARRVGESKVDSCALPLNGGLALCLGFGVPWVGLIAVFAPWWFPRLAGSEEIARVGLPYLYCRLAATVLVGMHFSFRAFWNATGRSKFYMVNLLIMHATNVLLDWVLIYGKFGAPALGVRGAGIASASAAVLGVSLHFWMALRDARAQGFMRALPTREELAATLRISLPTSLQQLFFAAGMTALMSILARAGTDSAAASKVLMDLNLAALLPAMGYGMAGTTLVSQALGRVEPRDAKQWGYECARVAGATVVILCCPLWIAPELVLSRFLTDASTIALAAPALRLMAASVCVDAAGMVLMNCLIGAGDSRRVMVVSLLLQWVLFLPAAGVLVIWLHQGLMAVWLAQAAYRTLQTGIFFTLWQRERWMTIRL
ncbi:MAG TPA: MATE family efflux transporter [Polyangiales bacterium]